MKTIELSEQGKRDLETWQPTGKLPKMDEARAHTLYQTGLSLLALRRLGRKATQEEVDEVMNRIHEEALPREGFASFVANVTEFGLHVEKRMKAMLN